MNGLFRWARAAVLLIAVLSSTVTRAEDSKIIVWLNDGSQTEVKFTDMPVFEYADGVLTLKSETTDMSWPLSQLNKFTFEAMAPLPTDIKDLKTTPKLDITKGCAVYDLNGRLIRQQVNSLSELPAGVYIVKDGNVSIKVVRR